MRRMRVLILLLVAGMLFTAGFTTVQYRDEPSRAAVAAGREVYQRLLATIEGTPRDRLVFFAANNLRIQIAVDECMTARGWDYRPWPVRLQGSFTAPGPPGDLTAWAPLTSDFGTAEMTAAARELRLLPDGGPPADSGMSVLSPDQQADWIADINDACSTQGSEAVKDEFPADYPALDQAFTTVLLSIQSAPGAQLRLEDWAACMAGYDIDVYTTHPGYDGSELWPGFRYAVEGREAYAAEADADCRRSLHEWVLADGASALRAFAASHVNELAVINGEWDTMRTEADQLLAAR